TEPVLDDDALWGIFAGRMHWRILRRDCLTATTESTASTTAVAGGETVLISRLEQMRIARRHRSAHLLERGDVVHDVEAAAMRGDDQITILECEIVNGDDRQVAAERLPVSAVVLRIPHAALGARDQQPALRRILTNDARKLRRVDSRVDARP